MSGFLGSVLWLLCAVAAAAGLCIPEPECREEAKIPIPCEGYCSHFFRCDAPGGHPTLEECPLASAGSWFNPNTRECDASRTRDCRWWATSGSSADKQPRTALLVAPPSAPPSAPPGAPPPPTVAFNTIHLSPEVSVTIQETTSNPQPGAWTFVRETSVTTPQVTTFTRETTNTTGDSVVRTVETKTTSPQVQIRAQEGASVPAGAAATGWVISISTRQEANCTLEDPHGEWQTTTCTPGDGPSTTPGEPATSTPGDGLSTTPGEGLSTTPGEPATSTPGEGPSTTPGEPATSTPGEGPSTTPGEGLSTTPGEPATSTPGEGPSTTPGEGLSTTPGEPATSTPGEGPSTTPGEPATSTPGNGATTKLPIPMPPPTKCTWRLRDIMLPHPTDCGRYIRCFNGNTWDMACAKGTKFVYELQTCKHEKSVNCDAT